MDNIAGSPVQGDNFFGREKVVAQLVDILANDDILLLGPRRIGKTSAARAVMELVRQNGWRAIEINVAACTAESGFLDTLTTALKRESDSIAGKVLDGLREGIAAIGGRIKSVKFPVPGGSVGVDLNAAAEEDWTKVASDLLVLISSLGEPWLIYVDELPILLFNIIRNDPKTGVQRVRRFLDWFRNDVRALPGAKQVRWLISGSVGLDTLVQEHGMADTINSLNHQGLDAFTEAQAGEMLRVLSDRYKLELAAEDLARIVAAVQWLQPYYLQVTFHHLRSLMDMHPALAPAGLIDKAIDHYVQPGADNDFHHWEQRLSLQLPPRDAGHAVALLSMAAASPDGARAESLLAALHERMPEAGADEARRCFIRLRDILQRDAYWWPDEGGGSRRYRFRLEPLRRWWLRRNTL